MAVSTSAQSVPLIFPNELEKLNDPPNGIIGNSIVQCLGNYPIRGVITPIFKAKEIYGQKDTPDKLKEFTFFDEKAAHYDIARRSALDMDIFDDDIDIDTETVGQVEQVEQAEPVREEKDNPDWKKRLVKKMAVLQSKLSDTEYNELITSTPKKQMELLDTYADAAASRGNILLAAELENVRSYIAFTV